MAAPDATCRRCGKTFRQHRRFTLDPMAAPMCYSTNREITFITEENPMATQQQYDDDVLRSSILDPADLKMLNYRDSEGQVTVKSIVDSMTVREVRESQERLGKEISRLAELSSALVNVKKQVERATRPDKDQEMF